VPAPLAEIRAGLELQRFHSAGVLNLRLENGELDGLGRRGNRWPLHGTPQIRFALARGFAASGYGFAA
jgi:hypothetical protein